MREILAKPRKWGLPFFVISLAITIVLVSLIFVLIGPPHLGVQQVSSQCQQSGVQVDVLTDSFYFSKVSLVPGQSPSVLHVQSAEGDPEASLTTNSLLTIQNKDRCVSKHIDYV